MPSLQEGDIITIKLMSGEEVLARLIEITDEAIKIAKPRAVVAIPTTIAVRIRTCGSGLEYITAELLADLSSRIGAVPPFIFPIDI